MTDRQSPTMVRNMDPLLWQQVKQEARRHDMSAGALLNLIVNEWMKEHQCTVYGGPLAPAEDENYLSPASGGSSSSAASCRARPTVDHAISARYFP